ncbi:MAG: hypothetical protein JWQ22_1501 [Devosia sp.]|nr:hypothetical protein [Devosia sp.]
MRVIRVLHLGGIQTLLDWAAAEGWNPGLEDAKAFQAADPDGFLGAFVDGVMVAAIAAVAYDEKFGFIGLYICHPDWRGQGHGRAVWDAGIHYLGSRTVGLDGVPEQQSNYASMGFVAAYETVRMSGTLLAVPSLATPVDSLDGVRGMDVFPAARDGFLTQWIAAPNRAWRTRAGFGVVRACTEGQKVGPLFAADVIDAMELLGRVEGAVQIDVPARQTNFLDRLETLGFVPGFRTTRMYRGPAPKLDMDRVFGISSLELG